MSVISSSEENLSNKRKKEINIEGKDTFNEDNLLQHELEYNILKKIGSGTYGAVFLAQRNRKSFALKQVLKINQKYGLPKSFIRELKTLTLIKHPNIVKFIECISRSYDHKIEIYMVFEYMPMDLYSYMKSKFFFTEDEIQTITFQIFSALKHLHHNKIVHRDIKPGNILVCDKNNLLIKLADFGLSRYVKDDKEIDECCLTPSYESDNIDYVSDQDTKQHFQQEKYNYSSFQEYFEQEEDEQSKTKQTIENNKDYNNVIHSTQNKLINQNESIDPISKILMTNGVCTLWYRAPEILLNDFYSFKIDIWSVGVIIFEMLSTENKLAGSDEEDQLEKISTLLTYEINLLWQRGKYSMKLKNLLQGCLCYDKEKRLTAENALRSPFFYDFQL